MDKKVTVLTPNGRRQNVKVTPNTTLLQILEETCKKHDFECDEFGLKHHNKDLDLTQMFRFSGLPNNCQLEMVAVERKRIATDVDICVQMEDGSRMQGKFKPSDNIWHVVEQLCPESAAMFESPVAIYMRQDIAGKDRLVETSLKSLGITEGRAMLRFINKNPDELKTQANVYIAPVVKEKPKEEETSSRRGQSGGATGGGGFAITKDLVQALKKSAAPEELAKTENESESNSNSRDNKTEKPKAQYDWGSGRGRSIRNSQADIEVAHINEEQEVEMEVEPEVIIIGERNAILYSLDATQKQIEELPDSFFDLTVHDLKLVLRDLKKIASGNEDTPLLTEKLRELEENKTMLNKIAQYKNCVIRVQFPDRHVLQGMFKPIDKVSHVIEFVRSFLDNQATNFHLFTIPPKTVLPLDKTLLELDFVPTAVVHFALDDDDASNTQQFFRAEFLEKLTTAEGAVFAANKWRIRKTSKDDANHNNNNNNKPYEHRSPGPSTGAIPKRPRNDDVKQST